MSLGSSTSLVNSQGTLCSRHHFAGRKSDHDNFFDKDCNRSRHHFVGRESYLAPAKIRTKIALAPAKIKTKIALVTVKKVLKITLAPGKMVSRGECSLTVLMINK